MLLVTCWPRRFTKKLLTQAIVVATAILHKIDEQIYEITLQDFYNNNPISHNEDQAGLTVRSTFVDYFCRLL